MPHAVELAKTFASELLLLHVMQAHHDAIGPHANDALGWEISRQEALGYLERLEREVEGAGQRVAVRLEQGRPAERIVEIAAELEADLTILASSGEGGVTPPTLGSTVQRVLGMARGSVFVVHPPRSGEPGADAVAKPSRILVPLDGCLRTESVLPTALRIARAHGAELLLVHVVREPTANAFLDAAEDMVLARALAARLESGAKRYLDHRALQLLREGVAVRTLVVRDVNERHALLTLAASERVDLIILSAHGAACDSAQAFGSVSTYFLTHSAIPLLVLQDLPEAPRSVPVDSPRPPKLRASYAPETA